jgi:RNA polymerase sigma factor (sigma-70 family)
MRAIARRQALAALRRLRPSRMIPSDAALDAVAAAITEVDGEHDARRSALDRCLESLPADWRALVDLRYRDGLAVTALAKKLSRRADTVSMHLNRVRAKLLDCIEGRLRREGEL